MEFTWSEMLDGQPHTYRQGRDFSGPAQAFADLVRKVAADFGLTAVVRVDGPFVAFQATNEQPILDEPSTAPPGLSLTDAGNLVEAMRLRGQGLSYREIGDRFGVSHQTARRHLLRAAAA